MLGKVPLYHEKSLHRDFEDISTLGIEYGEPLTSGCVEEGGWALEQAPQVAGHSTKPDGVPGVFGQGPQEFGGIVGVFLQG
ncbi:hypothetical protein DUI87_22746 [Hirundo rustica rustica]|uniref:Uncharacterized protein n=1 Tax=Hirundo rustica rustica TaxID=333673 RepID=A0A3M0JIT2_HIRRU|nr:hypothetical protein DUI87_22746 [Hirundo rustica rustica]